MSARTALIEVLFMAAAEDDDPRDPGEEFICAVHDAADLQSLEEIEAALQPSQDDYYQHGDGVYLVRAEYFEGQRADYESVGHSWEEPPGWGASKGDVFFLGPVGDLAAHEAARDRLMVPARLKEQP